MELGTPNPLGRTRGAITEVVELGIPNHLGRTARAIGAVGEQLITNSLSSAICKRRSEAQPDQSGRQDANPFFHFQLPLSARRPP